MISSLGLEHAGTTDVYDDSKDTHTLTLTLSLSL